MRHLGFFLCFVYCFALLASCQEDEDNWRYSSSLNNAAVDNKAAQALSFLMQEQKDAYGKLKFVLGSNTPKFELTQTGSSSEFGPYFLFPYVNSGNVITGCVIVPMDEEKTGMLSRKIMGHIGMPIDMNAAYLNESISKFNRFLYSYNFKKWEDEGEKVMPILSQYAHDISENKVKVCREEIKAQFQNITRGHSRASSPYNNRLGDLYLNFTLEYYKSPDKTDEVEVWALNPKTLEEIFQEAFRYYETLLVCAFTVYTKGIV